MIQTCGRQLKHTLEIVMKSLEITAIHTASDGVPVVQKYNMSLEQLSEAISQWSSATELGVKIEVTNCQNHEN